MIYHIEIEFRDADGNLQSRTFPRATSHSFETSTGLDIREGVNRFMIRDVWQVTRFEASTLQSRLTDDELQDMRESARLMCENRRRIPAIKLVRETLGLGLKDAKDYTEELCPIVKDPDPINDPNSQRTNFDDIPF